MPTDTHFIDDITPRWTTKVQVVEKLRARTAAGGRRFQRLVLEDSQLTRVQATIFETDIEVFQDTLLLNKKYYVSNAIVRAIAPAHRIVPSQYQWTINTGTLVEEATEDTGNDISRQYNFTPFSDLQLHSDCISAIDIIVVAVRISPPQTIRIRSQNKETSIQELLLITEQLRPTTLTLWDEFVSNEGVMISNTIESWPIVVANRLKVVIFNKELSLSTKSNSFFLLNPDIPQAISLRAWSSTNKDEINNTIEETPPTKRRKRASPAKQRIVDIATATRTQPKDPFWIKGTASITDFNQRLWYIGCSNCYRTIYADIGKVYNCLLCNQHEVTAQPRCRFNVEVQDSSGTMAATCLGQNAEKLFQITVAQLIEHTNKDGTIAESFYSRLASAADQFMLIKSYEQKGQRNRQQNPTIISVGIDDSKPDAAEPSAHPVI